MVTIIMSLRLARPWLRGVVGTRLSFLSHSQLFSQSLPSPVTLALEGVFPWSMFESLEEQVLWKRCGMYVSGFYKSRFTSSFSLQFLAVLEGTFAVNILKIEAWKPICQVEVCRHGNPRYRSTKLAYQLSCPIRLIPVGLSQRVMEGLECLCP